MKLPALKEIVEERKEKAVEDLSTSFAKNRLPLEEYERLVEYINKIESERELIVIEKIVAEYGSGEAPSEKPSAGSSYEKKGKKVYNDDDDDVDYRRSYSSSSSGVTLLSSRTVSGPLKSGADFVSILGSTHIKIRKEDLSKRRTVLNVVTILGDIVIMVEPGIHVHNNAIPILGNAGVDQKVEREAEEGEPELHVSGAALLGEIKVRLLKG